MNHNDPVPVVITKADRVVTNSRDVAEFFGKRHDHVIRDIEKIAPDLGTSWITRTDWIDAYGRIQKSYDLTRDGFTFLVMGFTGAKADAFKLAYLNEYNRMEEELRKRAQQSIPTDYASALRLAADEHEKRLILGKLFGLPMGYRGNFAPELTD